jgi:hypothetical protein
VRAEGLIKPYPNKSDADTGLRSILPSRRAGFRPLFFRLETGGWRLEAGDWRLETGGWRLEAGDLL